MKKDTKLILIVLAGILAIVLLCIFAVQGTQNKAFTLEEQVNTACGETVYGTPCVFGRVLTLDEYRRYRKYIPLASDWYWLATSYSPYSSSYSNAYYVNTDGSVSNYGVYDGPICARPALYLESSILVSVEVEKVTALQRETLTACKNAELIAELFRRIPGVQED